MFKALGDPARVRILNLVATSDVPVCACNLIEPLGLTQPTVSHHLKKLTDAGLLRREQRGMWAYYSIEQETVARLRVPWSSSEKGAVMNDQLREEVRQHYAAAATRNGSCCGFGSTTGVMSLGSGDPLAAADLRSGERVLDLGSGAGRM